MPRLNQAEAAERLTPLQIATLFLSIYVLVVLVVQAVFRVSPETEAMLERIDFFVCLVFLGDFFVRLWRAPSKPAFLKWGWIDFVSSIPMLDVLRVGRVVRIVRLIRILRAFRSSKNLLRYLVSQRQGTSLAAVASVAFVLMIFAAITVLQFETLPESNIKNAGDAFWWAFVTVTTVGYGDKFPITTEGRVVACILMAAGVGLFGSLTGFVATLFVKPGAEQEKSELNELTVEVRKLREKVEALEAKLP